jgi:DNA-binding MarR family transcriptional regulator/predicted hydrocarbon binding protein
MFSSMSVCDRGRSFGIFYTDMGMKCVNSEIGMRIMDMVDSKDMTLAEISKGLNLPVSTVLFNTSKLEEKRLIGTYKDDRDRRKVYYCKTSLGMIVSMEPSTELQDIIEEKLAVDFDSPPYFYRYIICLLNAGSIKLGLNLGPLMERVGRLIGKAMIKELKGRSIDSTMEHLNDYFNASKGPKMNIVSYSPMKIELMSSIRIPNNADLVFRSSIGIICSGLECATGEYYVIIRSEIKNKNGAILFEIGPRPQHKKIKTSLYTEDGFLDIKEGKQFQNDDFSIILDKNGCPRMIDIQSQIEIINALEIKPDTLKGLNDKLGGSQSTLFSNLTKLEDAGIIYSVREFGPNLYNTYGGLIISKKNNCIKNLEFIKMIIKKAAKCPEAYYRSMFQYIMMTLDATSIDSSKIQNDLGKTYAKTIIKNNSETTLDDLIMKICNLKRRSCTKLKLESYIPLTFVLECTTLTNVGCHALMQFYIGELSEVIFIKIKKRYVPTNISEITKERGVLSYRFLLEPE